MLLSLVGSLSAKENVQNGEQSTDVVVSKGSGNCQTATAQTELNINNVRTRLLTGGDMWWDLNSGQYEIPKVEPGSGEVSRHSLFAGALWIGGVDALGQLKVAAQTYRQSGNDFYPGPLDQNGQVSEITCSQFDRFWEVKGEDIDDYRELVEAALGSIGTETCPQLQESEIPASILEWPGRNNQYFEDFTLPVDQDLAPFWDCNGDGEYDPLNGDYPVIDPEIEGVYADQMIWWVLNDQGNDHSETGGEAIGLEIGALAFAFATNDEVNNMTFYKYVIENNATTALDSVYFGQWVDPDLGEYQDDYVGCDTTNSLGIVYNGNAVDGPSEAAYPGIPPMLAVDFFQGPKDENGNELGMSSFLFYNNDFSVNGNPETASHYYQYLAGFWKDGLPFTFGGNGYGGTDPAPFMFPTDPSISGDVADGIWSECSEGIDPADRRFLQNSGPFSLLPGAVNDLIVGVVWVDEAGGCGGGASFDAILKADQKAQGLFDSNFAVEDGPDAPNLTIRELDQELIISLWNSPSSNNFREEFVSTDPILATQGFTDSLFQFQGYELYQLKKASVSAAELVNFDLARPVAVVDVANDGITRLINYDFDTDLQQFVPVVKVEGSDEGIQHTFRVTQDLFAEGDRSLINNKKYYYMAIAYAANTHEAYDPSAPSGTSQKTPYLAGRKNIQSYTAVPHRIGAEAGGAVVNTAYGEGPEIIQISGSGNGGSELELTEESLQTILADGFDPTPTYVGGMGPIDVKIYDPLLVQAGEYELRIERNDFANLPEKTDMGGTLTAQSDGTVSYEPAANFNKGYDHFNYETYSEDCKLEIASVVLVVNNPIVEPGSAFDDTYVIHNPNHFTGPGNCATEDGCPSIELDVLANDAAGLTPIIQEVVQPSRGTVSIDGSTLRYRGEYEFFGLVKFDYIIAAQGDLDTATVYINILDARETNPYEAIDDVIEIGSDGGSFNVLENDRGNNIGNGYLASSSRWVLENLDNGKIYRSERDIKKANEQAIGGWERDLGLWSNIGNLDEDEQIAFDQLFDPQGFTVSVTQSPTASGANALIKTGFEFENVQSRWLTVLADADGSTSFEWIRSGSLKAAFDETFALSNIPDYSDDLNSTNNPSFYDFNSWYESMVEGGFAPYCLANNVPTLSTLGTDNNILTISPACSDCYGTDPISAFLTNAPTNTLNSMCSVDIVLTDNKDLWTKVPVVEMGREASNNIGAARKNSLRLSSSVDKNGNDVAGTGMSWFPGYAINIETGERLNMMFSENSFIGVGNGRDMLYNPTSLRTVPGFGNPNPATSYKMGGEHWIYVMNSRYSETKAEEYAAKLAAPANESETTKKEVYDDAMYVSTTILAEGFEMTSIEDGLIPSEVKIRIRVTKPYTETGTQPNTYRFNMADYAVATNNAEAAASALDEIRVVPNPYYGFSEYENSKFDNTIKITNLPGRATVRIFSVDGTFVRELGIDNSGSINGTSLSTKDGTVENSLSWDLKNFKGVPIASGVYIINIDAPELGESKTLKWFGVLRQIDLDTF